MPDSPAAGAGDGTGGCSTSRCIPGALDISSPSVDLVAAARRLLLFLRRSAARPWPGRPSIRRYEEFWLPLAAEKSSPSPSAQPFLPPPDVEIAWLCHRFHHAEYKKYCIARFGFVVDRPVVYDAENEEYAEDRCYDEWVKRFPGEPFNLESYNGDEEVGAGGELPSMLDKYRHLTSLFSAPFVAETVFLVAAKSRYLRFLQLLSTARSDSVVPAYDVLLMWLTHQIFPGRFADDTAHLGDVVGRVSAFGPLDSTKVMWEAKYDEPYERAGIGEMPARQVAFHWSAPVSAIANGNLRLQKRLFMELCIFLKGELLNKEDTDNIFVRLRTMRCHRSLKLDQALGSNFPSKCWEKAWHLHCEFGSRGIEIEVRRRRKGLFRRSMLLRKVLFSWNDVLRQTTLTLVRELDDQIVAMVSITPPVQAPFLLKCVPDRVTDDSGAMISDMILQRKGYHPQEGRWLTRTVIDHCRKECFAIRNRVGRGIWRRGAETPMAVKWEDRIIEVREGPWTYIAGSVGYAPEKVVGTATPKREEQQQSQQKAMTTTWALSTGDTLLVQWGEELSFLLRNEKSGEMARLLRGRRLSYRTDGVDYDDDDSYLTLVRTPREYPRGRATALINWKLLAVEFLPEEDSVLILLVSMAVARTVAEFRREDAAGLLIRRRTREAPAGQHDWGSVLLPEPPSPSPHLLPWYWNAPRVLAAAEAADRKLAAVTKYSPADGKDALYRQAIMP